jgi:hypothetical protein
VCPDDSGSCMGSPDIEDDATAAAVAPDQDALSSGAGEPKSSNGPRKKMQCQVRFTSVTRCEYSF